MEFVCVFFLLPLFSILLGLFEQMITKNIYVIGFCNLLLWLLLTFTVFNRTFLIWAILNALIATLCAYVVKKTR